MRQEPVDLIFTRSILEAMVPRGTPGATPESVWEAFQRWNSLRGNPSFPPRHLLYHQLQDLFEFAIETHPAGGGEPILKAMGHDFGESILKRNLSDFLASITDGSGTLPEKLGALFLYFMKLYAPHVYRCTVETKGAELELQIGFSDPASVEEYLKSYRKSPSVALKYSCIMIAAATQACLAALIDPLPVAAVAHEEGRGLIVVPLPRDARFNFGKLVRVLTDYIGEIQIRSDDLVRDLDLERDLILQSTRARETWNRIRKASASDETILLRGEPGTGKTHLARRIHELSPRAGRPFVEVGLTSDVGSDNFVQSSLFGHVKGAFTSAIENRQGLFAVASPGTIFLDEIGDASLDLQSKLLRVIESRRFKPLGSTRDVAVDVRIIAATNRNLEEMVQAGTFREDLYYRLNVIQLEMAPLRTRKAEFDLFADYFLRRAASELRKPSKPLSEEALALLRSHEFPGNFRELIHVFKHALVFAEADSITPNDLPPYLLKSRPVRPARASAPPPETPPSEDGVIDTEKLRRLLAEAGDVTVGKKGSADLAWHIDHAKKTYLRILIEHHGGNLRKIANSWERSSEQTIRALIRKLGLADALDRARARKKP